RARTTRSTRQDPCAGPHGGDASVGESSLRHGPTTTERLSNDRAGDAATRRLLLPQPAHEAEPDVPSPARARRRLWRVLGALTPAAAPQQRRRPRRRVSHPSPLGFSSRGRESGAAPRRPQEWDAIACDRTRTPPVGRTARPAVTHTVDLRTARRTWRPHHLPLVRRLG